eukprot:6473512-Amphidinium_carterae.1
MKINWEEAVKEGHASTRFGTFRASTENVRGDRTRRMRVTTPHDKDTSERVALIMRRCTHELESWVASFSSPSAATTALLRKVVQSAQDSERLKERVALLRSLSASEDTQLVHSMYRFD